MPLPPEPPEVRKAIQAQLRRSGGTPDEHGSGGRLSGQRIPLAADAEVAHIRTSLGQTIKALRTAKGLSTRELAGASGVSPGFISQIENGRTMPSVAKLVSLASAMKVLVGDLFQAPIGNQRVVRRDQRPTFTYASLGLRDEVLSSDPTNRLEVLLGHIDPGRGSGPDLYTHGSESEFIFIVAGVLKVFVDDETFDLREGDAITFDGQSPHGYTNPGGTTTTALWVYTPASY
jgi:transcriptional regulator with XRE-family HTH domain